MGTAERIISRRLYRYRRPPQPGQSRVRKLIVLFLVFWLAYVFIGSRHGVIRIVSLHREKAQLERKKDELRVRLKHLEVQAKLMEKDPFYIEKVAREEFGLARKGEIVYRIQESE